MLDMDLYKKVIRYIWSSHYNNKRGWFRLFGYGISFKNLSLYSLVFSERIGKCIGFKIGNYYFRYLPK